MPVEVSSLRHEARVRGMIIVKSLASSKRKPDSTHWLVPMWCELDLASETAAAPYAHHIDEELIKGANLCHDTANSFLDEASMKNGALVTDSTK